MSEVQVSGATHEVGVDQLFFSTTDARGVILSSNNVFVELSRYTREELVGSPHNIIRHPEMPGGAFRAMWTTLEEGHPFAAYVRNLAADGSEYDVFATVTPLPDGGYLSVRTRPLCDSLFETACAIYRDTREVEDQAIAQGDNRRAAAVRGAARIGELLDAAGMSSYEDFQNTALPAEVARREQLSAGLPRRPKADGDLRVMLDAVTDLATGLDAWMASQDELAELSAALKAAGDRLTETLEDPNLSAQAVSALDRSDSRVKPLGDLLDLWGQMQGIVRPLVARLADTLTGLSTSSARTRFRIALVRLHTTVMATFTAEIIDAVDGAESSVKAVPDLVTALAQGLEELQEQAQTQRAFTSQAVSLIEEASRMMTIPHQLLMLWTGYPYSKDPDLPEAAARLSAAASQAVDDVGQRLERLDEVAWQCQSVEVATDFSGLRTSLERLRTAAGSLTSVASAAPEAPEALAAPAGSA